MKKYLLILSIFTLFCIGCNIDEPKRVIKKESTELNELTQDKLILELQELNDSLIQSKQTETRGRFKKFLKNNSISPDGREMIYYSLSIAAYSTEYWKKKYESENK